MARLAFYGSSDDLVEVEGVVNEEFNAERADLLVVCPDGRQAYVSLRYTSGGVWGITYRPVDEDIPAPGGELAANGYTAVLVMDVPDGTHVHRVETLSIA